MTSSAYNPLRSSAPPEYKLCHDNMALLRAELKATADERDMLRRKVDRLRCSHVDDGQHLVTSGPELRPVHSYDWLKAQCDTVMDELHMLQQQHSDMVGVQHISFNHSSFYLELMGLWQQTELHLAIECTVTDILISFIEINVKKLQFINMLTAFTHQKQQKS